LRNECFAFRFSRSNYGDDYAFFTFKRCLDLSNAFGNLEGGY